MKTLKGISAASGIAKGLVCIYSSEVKKINLKYSISSGQIAGEIKRVRSAFARARDNMKNLLDDAKKIFDEEDSMIFNAHMAILNDNNLIQKVSDNIRSRSVTAETAIQDIFDAYIARFKSEKGRFKELTHDFADTRDRVLESLGTGPEKFACPAGYLRPVVIAAKRLTPSMVLRLSPENVLAFLSEEGGLTNHATILARSFGVPILLGIQVESELDCSSEVIVDGSRGKVFVDPDEKTRDYYDKKIKNIQKKKLVCEIKRDLSPRTRKGVKVGLKINISTPEEYDLIKDLPHEGIGLLRTEFLFTQRNSPPGEEEQYELYKRFLENCPDKPITVRLLDIGADKIPPYLSLPSGMNIDMGLRGAFAVTSFPNLYLTQVKALLRANTGSNLRILYPMVSDLEDLYIFRTLLAKAKKELRKEKSKFNARGIKEGVMIETPGGVMMLKELLKQIDFVNIGSNDLLQYTLAASRGNLLVEKRYHILHPSMARLLELIAKETGKAGKEACLCGEIASFEEYYPLFLQMGLRSFSVSVSKFEDIKCELLHLHLNQHKDILKKFYNTTTREDLDKFFEQFV